MLHYNSYGDEQLKRDKVCCKKRKGERNTEYRLQRYNEREKEGGRETKIQKERVTEKEKQSQKGRENSKRFLVKQIKNRKRQGNKRGRKKE